MKTREKNKMKIVMNKQILEGNTQVADNLPLKCTSSFTPCLLKKNCVIFKLKYKFLLLRCEIWNKHYFIENFCK